MYVLIVIKVFLSYFSDKTFKMSGQYIAESLNYSIVMDYSSILNSIGVFSNIVLKCINNIIKILFRFCFSIVK